MPDVKIKDNNPLKKLPAANPRTALRMKDETQDIKQRTPSEYAEKKVTDTAQKSEHHIKLQVSRFAKKRLIRRKELSKTRQVQAEYESEPLEQSDSSEDSASTSQNRPHEIFK